MARKDSVEGLIVKASTLGTSAKIVSLLPSLDAALPRGGVPVGSLIDIHGEPGVGALELALRIAANQPRDRNVAIVGSVYPPALFQAGLSLERVLLVRAPREDVLGCLDELLRSRAIGATVASLRTLDGARSHRLRVAAETGGGLGLLVRPLGDADAVSGAALRLAVSRDEQGMLVRPLRVRGGAAEGPWRI